MLVVPTSRIILLKNPIEIDYMNELTFSTKQDQYNYFYNLPKIECERATYQRKDGVVRFPTDDETGYNFDDLIQYNYCMYQNDNWSDKWFYAFVKNVTFDNTGMSLIEIETDVWQTWMFDITLKDSFIEREHVNNDTFGNHTVPEGLETGEFVINSVGEVSSKLRAGYYIIAINKFPANLTKAFGKYYGNVASGLAYYLVRTAAALGLFIKAFDNLGIGDGIVNIFAIPVGIVSLPDPFPTVSIVGGGDTGGTVEVAAYEIPSDTIPYAIETSLEIAMNTTLNGYTPKNNKMFTSEFNYLLLNNNAGQEVKYNYEDFISTPKFNIDGVICPGCSIKMYPVNYKKYNDIRNTATPGQTETHRPHFEPLEFNYGITAGKYPTCSWTNDAYTNWLTQQAVNEKYNDARQVLGFAGKSVDESFKYSDVLMPLVDNIMNKMQTRAIHQFMPNQTSGNINSGDVAYSSSALGLQYAKMSVRYEFASKIDNFFSHFGYRVNEFKTPNINTRTYWNYIKTSVCNLIGDIPQGDLEKIKDIFNKGVTFWHDPSKFLDYSQNNTIVT